MDRDWEIPASGWHLDSPPAPRLPAVRMFAYLSEVPARGGGTLVVEGSHRLAAAYPGAHSRTVRDQLSQQDPWLREIWHPASHEDRITALMDHGAETGGVRLRVAELTGAPGDVVLWHPALFHTAAPNTARHPRLMLTHTALRRAGDIAFQTELVSDQPRLHDIFGLQRRVPGALGHTRKQAPADH